MEVYSGKPGLSGKLALVAFIINAIIFKNGFVTSATWYWCLVFTIPVLFMAIIKWKAEKKIVNGIK